MPWLGFAWVVCINTVVPFLVVPTLAHVVWATSFAQSIANQGLLSFVSSNAGLPNGAPIAFGLPAVYPMAALIRIGIAAYDAYTLVFLAWFAGAYVGARMLANRLGASPGHAVLLAVLWLTTPMVWAHGQYSMLSLGFALLPTYLLATWTLLHRDVYLAHALAWQVAAAVVAIFMDGYSFVMYAVAAGVVYAWHLIAMPPGTRRAPLASCAGLALAFCTAFILYRAFVGTSSFWVPPLELFRNFSVDVSFWLVPTRHVSWLADSLDLSVVRDMRDWYGDASVWETTFILPILLLAAAAAAIARKHPRAIQWACLSIICLGLYLALGPSLRAWSPRPSRDASFNLTEALARGSTGSAWFNQNMPALNNMRATYRWTVFAAFGAWLLVAVIAGGSTDPRRRRWLAAGIMVVMLVYIPEPLAHLHDAKVFRRMLRQLDKQTDAAYAGLFRPGERVVYLPHANEFVDAYLAARHGLLAYNVGGDKNVDLASPAWPLAMQREPAGIVTPTSLPDIHELLLQGAADVIVLPYYIEPLAAYLWPCPQESLPLSDRLGMQIPPSWECPGEIRAIRAPILAAARRDTSLVVTDNALLATIRLRHPEAREADYASTLRDKFPYPVNLALPYSDISWMFWRGWNNKEPDRVWSMRSAVFALPVPPDCHGHCRIRLTVDVYAASRHHVRRVVIRSPDTQQVVALRARDRATHQLDLALPDGREVAQFLVDARDATSPYAAGESADGRELGVAILGIELIRD
jgi:hypothetical protein